MNGKKRNKLALVKEHRKSQYLHTLDKLIDGEVPIEYVQKRWKKYKEVKGK
jgi:hypothetical protein